MERLKKECPDVRWVRPEGIHVTLKFIGHIGAEKTAAICAALKPIRSERPVEMQFRGLGFFPNERRPHVVWCGVEASPNLATIAADVEAALEPLGMAKEFRPFVPHLTVARIDSNKVRLPDLEKLVHAADELETTTFGSARETEIHLFESLLKPSGAEYKRLESFPLLKGAA
jgi:2'-5' RNA ligase